MPFVTALRTVLVAASPRKLAWDDYKPIIRSAVAAWLGLLLMLIPVSLKVLGQASFLVLVVAFANPPDGPAVKVVYNALWNMLFVCLSWAMYIIASSIATQVRTLVVLPSDLELADFGGYRCDSTPQQCFNAAIFDGRYVESSPSIVFGAMLFIGIAGFLYVKITYPQRIFSVIFGLVSLIITMLYGPLFPYYYPGLGEVFAIPIACQTAISIACSLLFWPETMSHAYTRQITILVDKIRVLAEKQKDVMNTDPESTDWAALASIKAQVREVRFSLATFRASNSLLEREFSYGQLGAKDLQGLVHLCRDLTLKLGGFSLFFDLVSATMGAWDDKLEHGLATTARPSLDEHERSRSRPSSVRQSSDGDEHDHFLKSKRNKSRTLLHEALHHKLRQIGIFEMNQYQEHEQRYPRRREVEYTTAMLKLSAEGSSPLIDAVCLALTAISASLRETNKDRLYNKLFFHRDHSFKGEMLKESAMQLREALEQYKAFGRLMMLAPYEQASRASDPDAFKDVPSRPLLRFFYLEFHLIRMAESTLKLIQGVCDQGYERPMARWHYPSLLFTFRLRKTHEHGQSGFGLPVQEFEDTDFVQDEFETEARDPDAEPPSTVLHLMGKGLIRCARFLERPDIVFCVKGALLVLLLALPALLKRSAGFYYQQRGQWMCIMAAFSLAPLTGDAAFTFTFRLVGTLLGALVALVLWYISCGNSSQGNVYGLGATMAVASFPMAYIRLRFIYVNPQPAIFFLITAALVVGYSWQDARLPSQANLGVGWSVAWRRATLVAIGVSAAFVWTFIPILSKPRTGRQVIRERLAKGVLAIGGIFTEVSNFSRSHKTRAREENIRQMVVRANEKLLVLNQRLVFSTWEPPISGRWPKERYVRLLELQREILDLLIAFVGCLTRMEAAGESSRKWMQIMLRRVGWQDQYFTGDVLASLFLVSHAIQTGTALPQVVPNPLISRFYDSRHYTEEETLDRSLPRSLDLATLRDPDYAGFAVASTITFAIVKRVDNLMQTAKELVGETFHATRWLQSKHTAEEHGTQVVNGS